MVDPTWKLRLEKDIVILEHTNTERTKRIARAYFLPISHGDLDSRSGICNGFDGVIQNKLLRF